MPISPHSSRVGKWGHDYLFLLTAILVGPGLRLLVRGLEPGTWNLGTCCPPKSPSILSKIAQHTISIRHFSEIHAPTGRRASLIHTPASAFFRKIPIRLFFIFPDSLNYPPAGRHFWGHFVGSVTRPMNRMPPVFLSRIRKRKGWSARKTIGGGSGFMRMAVGTHDDCCSCRGFGALFVHVDEGLVDGRGDGELAACRSCRRNPPRRLEGLRHAHGGERAVELELLRSW